MNWMSKVKIAAPCNYWSLQASVLNIKIVSNSFQQLNLAGGIKQVHVLWREAS